MSEMYDPARDSIRCGIFCPHPPILLPDVGMGRETEAGLTRSGMQRVAEKVAARKPEVLVCITPHGPASRDAICIQDTGSMAGSMASFGVPGLRMEIPVDRALTAAVILELEKSGIPLVMMGTQVSGPGRWRAPAAPLDHGCFVPLYFIRQAWRDFRIVHITAGFLSEADHLRAGAAIRRAVDACAANAMMLASGDLSHVLREDGPYGFHPDGPVFDREIENILRSGKLDRLLAMDPLMVENAAQCGLRPLCTLAGYLCGDDPSPRPADVEVYSHEGPFGVGYLTAYAAAAANDGGSA